MPIMTPDEIATARPDPLPDLLSDPCSTPKSRARAKMEATGQWHPAQVMGRRWGIGCVALEITQRCNLDCSLCYLSEMSEAVRDTPLQEIYRRIDMILTYYGPGTDVQVTGGEPTLRPRAVLLAIVRRIRERGMRAALFTNGIRATRSLLTELAEAGLVDVAFHVDTTQRRRGYATEADYDALREEYIERARGLPLSVLFNTTVHAGNFIDIPAIVRCFVRHSDVVRLASFQLQADTGRGVVRGRAAAITQASVGQQIQVGAGAEIRFDTPGVGHHACNQYAMTLVVNGCVHDVFDDPRVITRLLQATQDLQFDRTDRRRAIGALGDWLLRNPVEVLRNAGWAAAKLWAMRADLAASGGRADKLSFFIHNFMGADQLDAERIGACVFSVATAGGPISMCLHNAKRDSFILQQLPIDGAAWSPLADARQPARRVTVRHRA